MKTLAPDELDLLRKSVGSCATDDGDIANEEQCRIISILRDRGLVVPCYCDGSDLPHPKVTNLGITALECASVLEKTG